MCLLLSVAADKRDTLCKKRAFIKNTKAMVFFPSPIATNWLPQLLLSHSYQLAPTVVEPSLHVRGDLYSPCGLNKNEFPHYL